MTINDLCMRYAPLKKSNTPIQEVLGYYKGDEVLCRVYHCYRKDVELVNHHLDECMTIFV